MEDEKVLPIWFYVVIFIEFGLINILVWIVHPSKLFERFIVTICTILFGFLIFENGFKESWEKFKREKKWEQWSK